MADHAPVQPAFEAREIGAVARVEGIRAVENTEVVGDAFLLDVGVLAAPFDAGRRQVGRGSTVATEAACLRKPALQADRVWLIEDKAFQRDPAAFEAVSTRSSDADVRRDLMPGDDGRPRMTAVAISGLLGGVDQGQVPG